MHTQAIAALVTGLVLTAGGLFAGPAHAQGDIARPAVQDLASKPIGKVVVATGSVTLQRAGAVVVQASTAGQGVRRSGCLRAIPLQPAPTKVGIIHRWRFL